MRKWFIGLFILVCTPLFAGIDYDRAAKIPVQEGGRLKPLQTIGIQSLLTIQEKQGLRVDGKKISPSQWILEVLSGTNDVDSYPIFLIHHPDLKTLIKAEEKKKRFSFKDLVFQFDTLNEAAQGFSETPKNELTPYQKELRQLVSKLSLYVQLKASSVIFEDEATLRRYISFSRSFSQQALQAEEKQWFKHVFTQLATQNDQTYFGLIPPYTHAHESDNWLSMPTSILLMVNVDIPENPLLVAYHNLFLSIRMQDEAAFLTAIDIIETQLKKNHPEVVSHLKLESLFNTIQPFYLSTVLFFIALLLTIVVGFKPIKRLEQLAIALSVGAFGLHTFGLIARMFIQGRPPVTNLYSSSVFVGWFAIVLCFVLYKIYRELTLISIAAVIGVITLIIAHHLSFSGDTLEMMQAVLDSNFWLATHVITITMGYSAVFLAGGFGCVYVLKRLFGRLTADESSKIYKMAYISVCIGLVLSFVGTILGGIWADQSWGRFWGWDPKENGALMIVLWTAICLHARMAGWVKARGFMLYCIFGNMITSFSWFGVNMLGVGLHAYGFMDSALFWIVAFNLSQLSFIALGLIKPLFTTQK